MGADAGLAIVSPAGWPLFASATCLEPNSLVQKQDAYANQPPAWGPPPDQRELVASRGTFAGCLPQFNGLPLGSGGTIRGVIHVAWK